MRPREYRNLISFILILTCFVLVVDLLLGLASWGLNNLNEGNKYHNVTSMSNTAARYVRSVYEKASSKSLRKRRSVTFDEIEDALESLESMMKGTFATRTAYADYVHKTCNLRFKNGGFNYYAGSRVYTFYCTICHGGYTTNDILRGKITCDMVWDRCRSMLKYGVDAEIMGCVSDSCSREEQALNTLVFRVQNWLTNCLQLKTRKLMANLASYSFRAIADTNDDLSLLATVVKDLTATITTRIAENRRLTFKDSKKFMIDYVESLFEFQRDQLVYNKKNLDALKAQGKNLDAVKKAYEDNLEITAKAIDHESKRVDALDRNQIAICQKLSKRCELINSDNTYLDQLNLTLNKYREERKVENLGYKIQQIEKNLTYYFEINWNATKQVHFYKNYSFIIHNDKKFFFHNETFLNLTKVYIITRNYSIVVKYNDTIIDRQLRALELIYLMQEQKLRLLENKTLISHEEIIAITGQNTPVLLNKTRVILDNLVTRTKNRAETLNKLADRLDLHSEKIDNATKLGALAGDEGKGSKDNSWFDNASNGLSWGLGGLAMVAGLGGLIFFIVCCCCR